jgi:two-component system response regulator HydG
VGDPALAALPYAEARRRALLAFEQGYVRALLDRNGGNISRAARAAGLDRSNFKRVLRRAQGGAASGDDDDA